MKFSIIIPVYNATQYLRECLDSVLAQTYSNWEALCIDDGSTDGSGDILDEYAEKDKRIRVFHQKNSGSSAARNLGLENATGQWIWFVDSDDYIEPHALATFEAIEHKADVTYFSMRVLYQDGMKEEKHLGDTGVLENDAEIDRLIKRLYMGPLGDVFGWTWDTFIRREIISKFAIRFNTDAPPFEDEVFKIQVMEYADSLAAISNVFYNYRIVGTGLTAKGISNPYALANAYFMAGSHSKRNAICELVDIRVTSLTRTSLYKQHSIMAAKLLLRERRFYRGRMSWRGKYNAMLNCLGMLPEKLACGLLVMFHMVKK